ncbi:hypothetical protein D0T12_10230 [Actinomadura spongiicola]|uniref:Uncharacterized protein n=1 Tax=Actinomadura spongiicola TaxID=2303421 RepID=A0A372GJ73_9ACTN|nr:hypothetical protein D0T12_10230 [Actinomadura spongiicola]
MGDRTSDTGILPGRLGLRAGPARRPHRRGGTGTGARRGPLVLRRRVAALAAPGGRPAGAGRGGAGRPRADPRDRPGRGRADPPVTAMV